MEKVDAVILGNGPVALSVTDKYVNTYGNGKVILLSETCSPRGAYSKGVKSVNSIVTKLPNIIGKSAENYKYITRRVKDAEIALGEVYKSTYPYQGNSKIGIRCCRDAQEHDVLCSIDSFKHQHNSSFDREVLKFVRDSIGHDLEGSKLFAYSEKIWNISRYFEFMASRIPDRFIRHVDNVRFLKEEDGIILSIDSGDGYPRLIQTQKLLVCQGLGNISFEKNVRSTNTGPDKVFSFKVLDFFKFFYKSPNSIPEIISSIMLPEHNVCLTNEAQNMHSILYNTNAGLIAANSYNPEYEESMLNDINMELLKCNPAISRTFHEAFKCGMTLNQQAYSIPDFHFEFIKSESVVDNIHYLNLPYFTVIQLALQSLPDKLIDIK